MQSYFYKALDKSGVEKEGYIDADSYKDAFAGVKALGLYPVEIYQKQSVLSIPKDTAKPGKTGIFTAKKVKKKDLAPFINDLAVMIDSGVPLVRALSVLATQVPNPALKNIVLDVRSGVESGQTFSESLAKHPEVFNKLFINMTRAGEVGGVLPETLKRLAILYDKSVRLESKLKAALIYPLMVLLFAGSVVTFVVAFIVPKFFVVFEDMGAQLPAVTQALYFVSSFIREKWYVVAGMFFFAVLSVKFLMKYPPIRYFVDTLSLKIPVFGPLLTKIAISRFTRTFGTLIASGVPILQTVAIAKDAVGNMAFERVIEKVRESIKEGEGVSVPISRYKIFPPLVSNMITVGEETSNLSNMLVKIADRYDDDVDIMVSQLTSLIEPFLIIGLGIIVAVIVIALFLPLVAIVENIGTL